MARLLTQAAGSAAPARAWLGRHPPASCASPPTQPLCVQELTTQPCSCCLWMPMSIHIRNESQAHGQEQIGGVRKSRSWYVAAGGSSSRRWSPVAAARGSGRRWQHLEQATTGSSSVPPIAMALYPWLARPPQRAHPLPWVARLVERWRVDGNGCWVGRL